MASWNTPQQEINAPATTITDRANDRYCCRCTEDGGGQTTPGTNIWARCGSFAVASCIIAGIVYSNQERELEFLKLTCTVCLIFALV